LENIRILNFCFSVLNGQRFFRQGSRTPPEFRSNGTAGTADTRANGDRKCGLGFKKQKNEEQTLISQRALPSQDKQPVSNRMTHISHD